MFEVPNIDLLSATLRHRPDGRPIHPAEAHRREAADLLRERHRSARLAWRARVRAQISSFLRILSTGRPSRSGTARKIS